jgi:hypothetical protein
MAAAAAATVPVCAGNLDLERDLERNSEGLQGETS